MKKKKAEDLHDLLTKTAKECEEMIRELNDKEKEQLRFRLVNIKDLEKANTALLENLKSIQEINSRLQERRKEQADEISKLIIVGELIEKELMKRVENLSTDDPLRKSLLFVSRRISDLKMMKFVLDQQIMIYEVMRKEDMK